MLLSLVQPVKDRYKSHARWADHPNGDLIIFVPGFIGNATSTWLEFPSFLSRSGIRNADILFFGHNGGRSQLTAIVGLLTTSIEKLWGQPKKYSTFPKLRSEQFRYRRLFLCGHSMGCVAIRDAVVAGAEQQKVWANHIAMVMFAPAHKGISASLMMLEKFAKARLVIGQWPLVAFNYAYPAVAELRPDSPYLKTLELRTDKAAKISQIVLPRLIIFGEMDKVVGQGRFSIDPYPPVIFVDKDHTTVCKPRHGKFEEPYDLLAQALL
jgi:pimeloyl-ACP methyl ester carboxylesterase